MPPVNLPQNGHIRIIDFLRGIAALLVVLLHFNNGGLVTVKDTALSGICSYGAYGVQIFFVISGFIIPYALYRSGYQSSDFFRHISRRFVRIDPPAYISALLFFALYYGGVFILGRPINGMEWPGVDLKAIFANLTYTVDYFDTSWYNLVFWTLAIEFQFYLLVGLLLPLLMRSGPLAISAVLVSVLMLFYLPFYSFFRFGSFFVMGIVLFLEREKRIAHYTAWVLLALSLLVCLMQRGPAEAAFSLFAVICIRHFSFSTPFTDHLGKISFSLYLTHLFAGWTAEIAVAKFVFVPNTEIEKILMMLVYIAWAVVFATIFYRFIERPFVSLSKKIKWRKAVPAESRLTEGTVVAPGATPALD